jgi:hypothetical protein
MRDFRNRKVKMQVFGGVVWLTAPSLRAVAEFSVPQVSKISENLPPYFTIHLITAFATYRKSRVFIFLLHIAPLS